MTSEARAVYVHVPFCRHRCGYCDFTLVAGRDELIADYLRGLEIELRSAGETKEVDTLFLGGGTPSHLSVGQLERLMGLLFERFSLAEGYEFSVEANPADLGGEKIDLLAEAGVNRVSLGIQSFDSGALKVLERDHRRGEIVEVAGRLKRRLENISFDLIFGVPGQSVELWEETLEEAIELGPEHVSTYGLTFEKGTSFWSRREKGELVAAAEESEREMYALAMDMLPEAGLEQYELSNFAREGFRCRHNEVYWSGEEYYGFGPGAGRYLNGRRETNHRSVTTWIRRVLGGESGVGEAEELSPQERAREGLVIGLRRCAGVEKDAFAERFGVTVEELAGEAIGRFVEGGLLEETGTHVRLTREGRFLADTVVVGLL